MEVEEWEQENKEAAGMSRRPLEPLEEEMGGGIYPYPAPREPRGLPAHAVQLMAAWSLVWHRRAGAPKGEAAVRLSVNPIVRSTEGSSLSAGARDIPTSG
jgi:hypothetical protein